MIRARQQQRRHRKATTGDLEFQTGRTARTMMAGEAKMRRRRRRRQQQRCYRILCTTPQGSAFSLTARPVGLASKPSPHGTGAVNSDPALVLCDVGPKHDQLRGARRTFKTYGQVVNVSLPSSEPRRVCSIPNIPTLHAPPDLQLLLLRLRAASWAAPVPVLRALHGLLRPPAPYGRHRRANPVGNAHYRLF